MNGESSSVLENFEKFAFTVIFANVDDVVQAIKECSSRSHQLYNTLTECRRDIRLLYCSDNGPLKDHSARIKAFLLSSISENLTVSVSSSADGHGMMMRSVSKELSCTAILFRMSRMDVVYPGNFLECYLKGESIRSAYAMKDGSNWVFWEKGAPAQF